jgi:uncharacterized membrane protein YfcA
MDKFKNMSLDKRYLPIDGVLSGFFGGLSGHQGALRSVFLMKCDLKKENFIATGVLIACLVDITRISIYSTYFLKTSVKDNFFILIAATLSAFLGAFIGNKLLKKITIRVIQIVISIMLFGIAIGLGFGFL